MAENILRGAERVRSLFPDVEYDLEELIAEGDRVVAIFRVTGAAAEATEGEPLDHHGLPTHRRLPMPIQRIWHGWTEPENADAYARLLHERVFPEIEAMSIPAIAPSSSCAATGTTRWSS